MNSPKIRILWLLVFSMFAASAKSPAESPVADIPESACWEMIPFIPEGKPPEASGSIPQLQRVETTRNGPFQKVVVDYGPNLLQTFWMSRGEVHIDINDSLSSGKTTGLSVAFLNSSNKFFGTEWITPERAKGKSTVAGIECDLFETVEPSENERLGAQMAGLNATDFSSLRKAWIDPATRLPVAVSTPEGMFLYKFLTPPSAPLQLPAKFRERQLEREAELKTQQQEASVR